MFSTYLKGFGLGAGLIVAIGAQNAHVLRVGLQRRHVALTVLLCICCEALLITAGVAGVGSAVEASPWLAQLARWGGAAFLLWYGLRAWRAAAAPQALQAEACIGFDRRRAAATVLAVTLLNPHVYLDTVVILGAIGGQFGSPGKWWFALGAVTAGMLWFPALGFGARLLAPLFARPLAWRVLDFGIGCMMLALAAGLLLAAIA